MNNAALERSIRHRAGKRSQDRDEKAQRGIHISINGIAAGLRNTG